jgi:hypothetical protein
MPWFHPMCSPASAAITPRLEPYGLLILDIGDRRDVTDQIEIPDDISAPARAGPDRLVDFTQ